MNFLISVILPVYNGEKFISAAIYSILNQSYRNFELIIVDDCSTDNTPTIISEFAKQDSRITIITNQINKKLPASLNIGHQKAIGEYITWTSDDNIYELDAIEILLEELFEKKVDIIYSDFVLIDGLGNKVREVELLGIENIIFGNFIGCSFLYKRQVFERNKGYNENLFLVEDYDFWLRAILHSSYFHLKRKLYRYRKHNESLTAKISVQVDKKNIWHNNVFKMYENFCKSFLSEDYDQISIFLSKQLTYQETYFEWVLINNSIIQKFKLNLYKNINFSDKLLVEKVFLKKITEIMIFDKKRKNTILRSLFIISEYFKVIDINTIKILIKYSFFKKKNI